MRMASASRWLLAGLLLALAPAAALADVADFLGKPITAIRLISEGRSADDPRLLAVVETRVGQPLSMLDVRESVTHLFSLGRFEDVIVEADASAGGVALLYDLVPARPIERIAFTGPLDRPGVDQGDLREALVNRFGASPPVARAPDMAALLRDQLAARGYLHAQATPRADVARTSDRGVLSFAIDPGERTRIGSVEIGGPPDNSSAALLSRLDVQAGAPYEREVLNERIEQYIQSRRNDGYYQARLTLRTELVDSDRVANLTLTPVSGPRVRVVFQGDPLPSDRRDELVPIAREGSADEDLLEDSSNNIEDYFRRLGFRDATAPHSREESNGELVITFTLSRGSRYRVARIEVSGNASVLLSDLAPGLRVRGGQPFAAERLDADLSAIEDFYHRRGFAAVRADAAIEPSAAAAPGADIPVSIRILITENVRTIVGSTRVVGNASVPEVDLIAGLGLQPDQPFFLTQLAVDRDAIQGRYADLGFQSATVDTNPGLSADGTRADVVFTVHEGPRLFVDHVLIVGNERTRTEMIERELQVKPGDPLGLAALTESQRRLAALGLFRRARITLVEHGDETTRDVLVSVEEAPVTTASYGGGLEVGRRITRTEDARRVASERLEVAPRAFFEIGRRNLFGKNRSVNLLTRISLRPTGPTTSLPTGGPAGEGSTFGFREYRVLGTFREPRAFGSAADASLTAFVEQQKRSSFNFARRAFSAEAGRRLTRTVSITGNYQIQRTELFDEQFNQADKLLIDRLFPQLRLSSFSLSGVRDTRDDPVNPATGQYFSGNVQLAARRIGSEVGLLKSYLTAQLLRTLPRTNQVVFVANARLGVATGFAREIIRLDEQNQPIIGPDGTPTVDVVKDLPASERFFAGGDTTVRGFALDQLGTQATIDKDGFPIGGNGLVIFNAELRIPVAGGLGVVGFVDTGNVFARTTDIDFGQLRSAVGFGLRYRSPVGPIRVDLGFKVRRREIVTGVRESANALHISLGQAF
jgi:outer membrane protein insertion porin family